MKNILINKFKNLIRNFLSAEFIRFLLVGATNTLMGFSVLLFCQNILFIDPYVSNFLSFILCYYIAYNLQRKFTFKVQVIKFQALIYLFVMIISWTLNIITLRINLLLGTNINIAQAISLVVYVLSSYFMNKLLTFKKQ